MNLILVLFLSVIINIIHCGKGGKGGNIEAPVKLKNLICEYNETWFKGESCEIKAHSRVKRTAEIRAHLLKTIKNANYALSVYKRFSGWKPWVIRNVTVNGCEFLAGKNNIYFNIIKPLIRKYTSVNHSCPYYPGPLIISGVDLRDMALGTLVLPGGEYRLDFQVYTPQNFKICTIKFIAEVWEKF